MHVEPDAEAYRPMGRLAEPVRNGPSGNGLVVARHDTVPSCPALSEPGSEADDCIGATSSPVVSSQNGNVPRNALRAQHLRQQYHAVRSGASSQPLAAHCPPSWLESMN